MRYASCKSFAYLDPEQIDEAKVVEHLSSDSNKDVHINSGWETWACAWAHNNSFFAWSSGHRLLHLVPWDNQSLKRHDPSDLKGLGERKYHVIDCCEPIWSLAFGSEQSEDGHIQRKCYLRGRTATLMFIATGHASGKIRLWNCDTGHLVIELLDHRGTVRCLDFSKDGSLRLLSASQDNTLKLWDLNNDGNMYHTFRVPGIKFSGCSFSPDVKWVAAVGTKRTALLWRMDALKESPIRLTGHNNEVVDCAFSPDSALLATASFDTKIILWSLDANTCRQISVLGHLHPSPSLIFAGGANDHYVRSLSFSPNGCILGSVCDDGFVRMWNLRCKGDPVAIATVGDALSCSFSCGGGVMAVGCNDGDVYFLSTPLRVASLKSMCRTTVRKLVDSAGCDLLPLPNQMKKFLQYEDFVGVSRGEMEDDQP